MKNIEEKQIGKNWNTFIKVHEIILSLDEKITFRIFPLYVKYSLNDKVLAVVFFKGKFVKDGGGIDLGLNIKDKPLVSLIKDAKYMMDVNIKYSILIKDDKFNKTMVKNLIKLTK